MRDLGKLMVIWGTVVPTEVFLWCRGYVPQHGVLGSLGQMHFYVGEVEFPYGVVVGASLLVVGAGLSLWVRGERSYFTVKVERRGVCEQ